MDNEEKKFHVALFPWLAYGHLMPFLEVATFLAQKGHRVSFISTPKNLQKLPTDRPPSITLVELPLPRVHGLPDSAESTAELPNNKVPYLKKAYDMLEPAVDEFLQRSGVDWIIQDFASHWLPQVASRLGVNSAFFSVYSATSLAFLGPPSVLIDGPRQRPEDFTVVPEWIDYPSKVRFRLHEIVTHQDCMDTGVSDFQRFGKSIRGSKFVAVRSCGEFEADPLRLLEKLYGKPVVPMGLLPPRHKLSGGDERWVELKRWLEDKKEKSVFYVGLGTEVNISPEMIGELAGGIEKSGLPFVWVVGQRPGPENIPPGFESRVAGRGYLWMGWAPQAEILAHTAIGGILTHCGWSSAIESLGQGLPLILFSGANSDQGLMGRLFEERGVGFEVPRDEADGSFTSDSVAQTIRQVMLEPEGEQVRANAWATREIFGNVELQLEYLGEFARALQKGGS
ncbi:UDP-glycosyltransferase 91C1 [Eucalyptus grandis]|uniref:UDP-glycosyltransferase 91C1 n=1 Tax=Eucalyptus grandis TaxID=71139 RepID=UPI00192EB0ED|nr:UDP-glycosyltransferase 91C1 [Eucalyptus grandis]